MGLLRRYEIARVVAAPPAACFRVLVESHDVGAWWAGVGSALYGPSPWAPGTRLAFTARGGRPAWEAEVKEVIPDRLVELYYVGGDLRGAEAWEFEPVGSGARLVHSWRGVEMATIMTRALGFALGPRLHRLLFAAALAGLARSAERKERPPA
jgi:uncharacterized protein YndB with AHSA1/START domain